VEDPARDRPRDLEVVAPSLAELLARMLAARWGRTGEPTLDDPAWESAPEVRFPTLALKGCLMRLVLMALVFVALAVVSLFFLVGGVLQSFGP